MYSKKLLPLFTFYSSIAFISNLINAVSIVFVFVYGLQTFITLFWFKVILTAFMMFLTNYFKQKEYFYYYNLGWSKKALWFWVLLFDFALFIGLLILTYYLR